MENPDKLRKLAAWYREFAERAGNPAIWDARLQTAENFEREAARLEQATPLPASSAPLADPRDRAPAHFPIV